MVRSLSKSVVDSKRHSHRDALNLDFLLCLPGGAVVAPSSGDAVVLADVAS